MILNSASLTAVTNEFFIFQKRSEVFHEIPKNLKATSGQNELLNKSLLLDKQIKMHMSVINAPVLSDELNFFNVILTI